MMKISEISELIGRSRQVVTNWIENGVLPAKKINGTYYVSRNAVESLLCELDNLEAARANIEALQAEYHKQTDDYNELMRRARYEKNMNRYLSICVNYGVRTNFFGVMVDLMKECGMLKEKDADILNKLLNGTTYEELKEEYHTNREVIRQIGEKCIRRCRNLTKIRDKINSVERYEEEILSLKNENEVLKKMLGQKAYKAAEAELNADEKRVAAMDKYELNKLLSQRITNYDLSVRAINTLYCYKNRLGVITPIKTVGDLCKISRIEYMTQRNAGKKSADEIEAFLHKLGLSWDIDVDKIIGFKL